MTPSKFIGTLFQSRDMMHIAHLQTTSLAEHKALNKYYNGILELIDKFAEAYFGRNKRVEIIIPESKLADSTTHIKEIRSIMETERANYPSELQNIIDEMIDLTDNISYLLTLN